MIKKYVITDKRCLYMREKKYKGIFTAWTKFLHQAKIFHCEKEAEEMLLNDPYQDGPLEIKPIWVHHKIATQKDDILQQVAENQSVSI